MQRWTRSSASFGYPLPADTHSCLTRSGRVPTVPATLSSSSESSRTWSYMKQADRVCTQSIGGLIYVCVREGRISIRGHCRSSQCATLCFYDERVFGGDVSDLEASRILFRTGCQPSTVRSVGEDRDERCVRQRSGGHSAVGLKAQDSLWVIFHDRLCCRGNRSRH